MVKSLAVKLIGEFCTSKVERRSANAWRAGNANAISLNKHACSPCRPLSFSCTSSLPTHPSHIHSTPHPGHQQPMIPFKHLSLFFHSFFFGIFFFNSAWYSYYTRSCIYDFDVSSLSFTFLTSISHCIFAGILGILSTGLVKPRLMDHFLLHSVGLFLFTCDYHLVLCLTCFFFCLFFLSLPLYSPPSVLLDGGVFSVYSLLAAHLDRKESVFWVMGTKV